MQLGSRAVEPLESAIQMAAYLGFAFRLFLASLLPFTTLCRGGEYVFTRIANDYVTAPGNDVRFESFRTPAFDGQNVVFGASDRQLGMGIYLFDGESLSRVANQSTRVPNGGGAVFEVFGNPSVSEGLIAFNAAHSGNASRNGIYAFENGALRVVADETTILPDLTGTFLGFGAADDVWVDGDTVAFRGRSRLEGYGLFASNGSLREIVDSDSAVPGGTNNFHPIAGFSSFSSEGSNTAFLGRKENTGVNGIYLATHSALLAVADLNTIAPGGASPFESVDFPIIHDGQIYFLGTPSGGIPGIFAFNGEELRVVFDEDTTLAGSDAHAQDFRQFSLDQGTVALLRHDPIGKTRDLYLRCSRT